MSFRSSVKHSVVLLSALIVLSGCSKSHDEPAKDTVLVTANGEEVGESNVTQRIGLADNHLEFRYVEMGRDDEFRIDQNLNLSVPYRYSFSFQPVITDSSTRGVAPLRLTNGRVRVTFVLFASTKGDPKDDSKYLTSNEVMVDVGANGYVTGTVVLRYPHILLASGRQTLMMHLATVDKNLSQSYSGSLSFVDQQAVLIMSPDTRNGGQIHNEKLSRLETLSATKHLSPLAAFMAHTQPETNRVSDFPFIDEIGRPFFQFMNWHNFALSQEELTYALQHEGLNNAGFDRLYSTLSVKQRLCVAYLSQNPEYMSEILAPEFFQRYTESLKKNASFLGAVLCSDRNIDKYVKVQTYDFIERLTSDTPQNVKIVAYSNQEFGVYFKKEHNKGETISFGARFPGSLMLGLVDLFSFHHFDTHSMLEQGNFGRNQVMTVDMGTMNVSAEARACVSLTTVGQEIQQKPWLICESKARPSRMISESFYYYSQIFASNHSPFIDPYNPQTGVKVFVRGKAHMADLMHTFEEADFQRTGFNVFVQAHVPDLNQLNASENIESLTDQDVPGAIGRN